MARAPPYPLLFPPMLSFDSLKRISAAGERTLFYRVTTEANESIFSSKDEPEDGGWGFLSRWGSFWFGFFDFEFWEGENRRRGCGIVGIAERFPRAVGNEGKPGFGFPRFPSPVISTALFLLFSTACSRNGNWQTASAWLAASGGPPPCRFRPGQCGPEPPASALA